MSRPALLSRHESPTLAGILLLAMLVRAAAVWFSPAAWVTPDTQSYFLMARGILAGQPLSDFPNGFPLLIAGVLASLEALGRSSGGLHALMALNVLLSTGIVALAWGIGREVVGARWALLAAVGIALWPNQINHTRHALSEVPATVLLLLGLLLLLRRRPLWAGTALYLAAMVRTSLLPVAVLAAGWVLWDARAWRPVALYVVGLSIPFALEQVLLVQGLIAPPSNAGRNLLVAISRPSSEGVAYRAPGFSAAERAAPLATYLRFAVEQPGAFLAQRASALWELWGPWPWPGALEQPRTALVRVLIGLRFPLITLALIEGARRARSAPHVLLLLPIAVLTVIHTAYFSIPRFSYPAEPVAMVLAVSLAAWAWERRSGGRQAGGAKRARSQPSATSVPESV